MLVLMFRYVGFGATFLQRVAYWAYVRQVRGLPMVTQAVNLMLHGIELTPSPTIDHGPYLAHTAGTGITAASIGRAELEGGITIGTRDRGGFPSLGDGVEVGCGSRSLEPVAVGQNSKVGASAVVFHDVVPGCTVLGSPARPVRISVS